jgi:hypothetical protein
MVGRREHVRVGPEAVRRFGVVFIRGRDDGIVLRAEHAEGQLRDEKPDENREQRDGKFFERSFY